MAEWPRTCPHQQPHTSKFLHYSILGTRPIGDYRHVSTGGNQDFSALFSLRRERIADDQALGCRRNPGQSFYPLPLPRHVSRQVLRFEPSVVGAGSRGRQGIQGSQGLRGFRLASPTQDTGKFPTSSQATSVRHLQDAVQSPHSAPDYGQIEARTRELGAITVAILPFRGTTRRCSGSVAAPQKVLHVPIHSIQEW